MFFTCIVDKAKSKHLGIRNILTDEREIKTPT